MRVAELDLSPLAIAALRRASIDHVAELASWGADDLLCAGVGAVELCEIVTELRRHGRRIATRAGRSSLPDERHREMLRLRAVCRLGLQEIGERVGLGKERVRQLLRSHFELSGQPPAVAARRWAQRARHDAGSQP